MLACIELSSNNMLGVMYAEGRGVTQDDAQAVNWHRKAAEQGYAMAQILLGIRYREGRGVPQDDVQAVDWYRKAAEQGYAPAQLNLGVMYAEGLGAPQDYMQAHMWLNLATVRHADEELRKNAVEGRNRVAAKMTPNQLEEAQRLAREWKPARQ